jgi:hypothetical protein
MRVNADQTPYDREGSPNPPSFFVKIISEKNNFLLERFISFTLYQKYDCRRILKNEVQETPGPFLFGEIRDE